MTSNDIFVIIPVFNEEKNIESFLDKLKKYTKRIIVVNDGSTDSTKEILQKRADIQTLNLEKNQGKGQAMKIGAEQAWKLGAKGVVFMDGDNQHNPKYLPDFFNYLQMGQDIIIGVRILKANVPIIRKLGNILLVHFVKIVYGIWLEDLICGYRGFSKQGCQSVQWESRGYGVETEVVSYIGRKKLPYKKIIVDTIYLDKYKGFSIRDGLKVLSKLPYWRFKKL